MTLNEIDLFKKEQDIIINSEINLFSVRNARDVPIDRYSEVIDTPPPPRGRYTQVRITYHISVVAIEGLY